MCPYFYLNIHLLTCLLKFQVFCLLLSCLWSHVLAALFQNDKPLKLLWICSFCLQTLHANTLRLSCMSQGRSWHPYQLMKQTWNSRIGILIPNRYRNCLRRTVHLLVPGELNTKLNTWYNALLRDLQHNCWPTYNNNNKNKKWRLLYYCTLLSGMGNDVLNLNISLNAIKLRKDTMTKQRCHYEQCFKWKKISASTPLTHLLACELGGRYQQIIKY